MKKKKLIFILNTILFIVFLLILEYCSYLIYCKEYKTTIQEQRLIKKNYNFYFSFLPQKVMENKKYNDRFFADYNSNTDNKGSILILGSSYAAGLFLEKDQTIAYKLNNKTNRHTYCRAICGAGPQYIHYMFKNKLLKFNELEYIIYVYTPEHIIMLEKIQGSVMFPVVNFRYKLENSSLEEIKPFGKKFYSYYMVRNFQNFIERVIITNNIKKGEYYKKFNVIMAEISKYKKEQYPNAKFIILEYPAHRSTFPKFIDKKFQRLSQEEISYLNSIGYQVLNLNNLTNVDLDLSEYKAIDNDHPNEKAIELISNEIIKFFKLSD